MTYEVHDRGDVNDKLKQFGVDSVNDIRHAHGSRHHRIRHAGDAAQIDLNATGSPDQISADLDALNAANAELTDHAHAVDALISKARDLVTPMRDGHGPIAHAMRPAFHERAADAEGVLRALTSYRDELRLVIDAVQQSMAAYGSSELDAARHLTARNADV